MNVKYITVAALLFSVFSVLLQSSGESSRDLPGEASPSVGHGAAAARLTLDPGFPPERTFGPFADSPFYSCDVSRDDCGSITPQSSSVFIADGAYNSIDSTLFFIDVPSGADGVFQLDPSTCTIVDGTYYSVNSGTSQRGIGYDPEHDQIWVGGWNDYYLNQHEARPPYEQIYTNYVGLAIASIAVDDANDLLFVATNSNPDMLYVFDMTGGVLDTLLGSWSVPWQSSTDGYDMAGMSFDDDGGQLVCINQYNGCGAASVREQFDFSLEEGLTGAGFCDLDNTSFAWGIAVTEDGDVTPGSYVSHTADIASFSPPFDVDEYGIPLVYPGYDLSCTVNEDNDIELSWSNAEAYDSVKVYMDGELIAVLPGETTFYLVELLCPPASHTFGVSGVIGEDESGQVRCTIYVYPHGVVCFDFDETDGSWTTEGYADFEWGYPSYEICENAWETNIGANYFNNSCAIFVSPSIDLGPEGGWIEFDTYNYIEENWDGWNIQISFDEGASWEMLYPLEGYDQDTPYGGWG